MKARAVSMIFALSLLVSFSAGAQEQGAKTELLAKLEQMLTETQWKVETLGGGAKGKWLLHQRKLGKLIDQLKTGQSIDPREIDELLKEHSR